MARVVTLLHVRNTLNYGTMMMGESLIYHLTRRHDDDLRFEIHAPRGPETLSRLHEALGDAVRRGSIGVVSGSMLPAAPRPLKILAAAIPTEAERLLAPWLLRSDLVVVLGGDDFTESYGYRNPILELALFRILTRASIPVVMVGQTIGPFLSWREPIARMLLRSVSSIITRDPATYRYLTTQLRLPNVVPGADLAFMRLAREEESFAHSLPSRYVCVVPSELLWRYGRDPDRARYLVTLESICRAVLAMMPDTHLVLLPHVLAPDASDDRRAARDLYTLLTSYGGVAHRVHQVDAMLLPFQARAILGGGILTITGRMHAAISAFRRARPAITLAYSDKVHGVIGEYMMLQELVVDVRSQPWHEVQARVVRAVELVKASAGGFQSKIRDASRAMETTAGQMIDLLVRLLRDSPSQRNPVRDFLSAKGKAGTGGEPVLR